jgi:hypothetical protein
LAVVDGVALDRQAALANVNTRAAWSLVRLAFGATTGKRRNGGRFFTSAARRLCSSVWRSVELCRVVEFEARRGEASREHRFCYRAR